MKRIKRSLLLLVLAVVFLAEWSPAPNPSIAETEKGQAYSPKPYNFSQGQGATFRPTYKPDLPTDYTMHDYLLYVLTDVHSYWSPVMVGDGYAEPSVTYSFPAAGEAILTECVLPAPDNPLQAFYCSTDDQIVITQEMALQLWNGTIKTNLEPPIEYDAGDFSVAFVVAHEYAHNLQAELRWQPAFSNAVPQMASRGIELNADCLSGAWANSVYARGLLETADIQEVMRTLSDIGQDSSTPNPTHGTPKERTDAFLLGFDSGKAPSCDPYLTNPY